jgi:uncharacterized protein (TIGR02147 family)
MDSKSAQHIEIYRYFKYRDFLKDSFPSKGMGRGSRAQLAEHLGCQPGFISLVFNEKSDFSLEHADQIANLLNLTDAEKNYFLLLVQKDRAGSVSLRKFLENQIRELQKNNSEIKTKITTSHKLSAEENLKYYQNWILTALHMCTLVPKLRNLNAMVSYLNIPIDQAKEALSVLQELGLVVQNGGDYKSTQKRIHLGEQNLALKKHHINWRMQSINAVDRLKSKNIHYTSVMSISESAFEDIKQILLGAISNTEPIIEKSKDEGVYLLNFDLFEIGQG